ncbi:hypothetical protein FRC01_007537, partial [Tulasnella sp. 417]
MQEFAPKLVESCQDWYRWKPLAPPRTSIRDHNVDKISLLRIQQEDENLVVDKTNTKKLSAVGSASKVEIDGTIDK